jgi:cytochrome c oxidase cbb3-type subunit IV
MQTLMSYLIHWWTPAFVLLFIAVLVHALRPRHRGTFDAASRMPLREE